MGEVYKALPALMTTHCSAGPSPAPSSRRSVTSCVFGVPFPVLDCGTYTGFQHQRAFPPQLLLVRRQHGPRQPGPQCTGKQLPGVPNHISIMLYAVS